MSYLLISNPFFSPLCVTDHLLLKPTTFYQKVGQGAWRSFEGEANPGLCSSLASASFLPILEPFQLYCDLESAKSFPNFSYGRCPKNIINQHFNYHVCRKKIPLMTLILTFDVIWWWSCQLWATKEWSNASPFPRTTGFCHRPVVTLLATFFVTALFKPIADIVFDLETP